MLQEACKACRLPSRKMLHANIPVALSKHAPAADCVHVHKICISCHELPQADKPSRAFSFGSHAVVIRSYPHSKHSSDLQEVLLGACCSPSACSSMMLLLTQHLHRHTSAASPLTSFTSHQGFTLILFSLVCHTSLIRFCLPCAMSYRPFQIRVLVLLGLKHHC